MSERFFKRLDEIDKIVTAEPSEAAAQRLHELVLEFSSELYLFNSVGPQWLAALERSGWFRNPPEPEITSERTHLTRWPASDFLVRVMKDTNETKNTRFTALIKRIVSDIPVVHNPF